MEIMKPAGYGMADNLGHRQVVLRAGILVDDPYSGHPRTEKEKEATRRWYECTVASREKIATVSMIIPMTTGMRVEILVGAEYLVSTGGTTERMTLKAGDVLVDGKLVP